MHARTLLRRLGCVGPSVSIAAAVLAAGAAETAAQLIPIRTVPVSQDHQFRIFPSHTAAMGGVAIAVRDSLLDPFTNPGEASRLAVPYVFSSPGAYSVSSEAGGGRTLPSGGFTRRGPWYAGVLLALQEVDLSERAAGAPTFFRCPDCAGSDFPPEERSPGNQYLFATLGREIPSAGLSVGGSVMWSGLDAVDGVDLLYAGSARIQQRGGALDLRLGLVKEWADERSLQALVLHNRFGMTHDVWYLDSFWDPGAEAMAQRPRLEANHDRTNTWGLHVEYQRPLRQEGWRIGWLGTVNYKSHPKIPNYEIMNIPRDPGHSMAFDLGVGFARTRETFTFGVDLVYEPIWSYTWADAAAPVETRLGTMIPEGGKTIENRFRFSNALVRMGIGDEVVLDESGTAIGVQWGLESRLIDYRLEQRDNVQISERDLEEDWVEWTPTWGIALRRPDWEIRYRGSVTTGTGRPGVGGPGGCFDICVLDGAAVGAGGSNLLVAPSGPLTLDPVSVVSHQLTLLVPLR